MAEIGEYVPLQPQGSTTNLAATMRKKTAKLRENSQINPNVDIVNLKPLVVYPVSKSLYQPQYVSIGPNYLGEKKLQNTQTKKWKFFGSMLKMFPAASLEEVIEKIKNLEASVKMCYGLISLSSDEFVEMLLLDSFFILFELTRQFPSHNTVVSVFQDTLLIENQIPFFIIETVWETLVSSQIDPKFPSDVIELFRNSQYCPVGLPKKVTDRIDHVLHLYYMSHIQFRCKDMKRHEKQFTCMEHVGSSAKAIIGLPQTQQQVRSGKSAMPSATELYEAGIKFKTSSADIYDINFNKGTIEIPTFLVGPRNMSIIANLQAYEAKCNKRSSNNSLVVSYLFLMDSLINTKRDIALLQKSGVINNMLETDEKAASFFNALGENYRVNASNNFYTPLMEDLMVYYQKWWRNQWTTFKQTYFQNPWTVIALGAATLALFLTAVQTYLTAFPHK